MLSACAEEEFRIWTVDQVVRRALGRTVTRLSTRWGIHKMEKGRHDHPRIPCYHVVLEWYRHSDVNRISRLLLCAK